MRINKVLFTIRRQQEANKFAQYMGELHLSRCFQARNSSKAKRNSYGKKIPFSLTQTQIM